MSNIGGSDRLLKISELIKFNVYAKKKYNTQREVGSKTKELLASIDTLEKKKFKEGPVTSFYAVCQILASWSSPWQPSSYWCQVPAPQYEK